MGIQGLHKLIKDKIKGGISQVTLDRFKGTRVGIDVSLYLNRSVYNAGAKGRGSHVRAFNEMTVLFRQHNIDPIYVFDGKGSSAKSTTVEKRHQVKQDKLAKVAENTNSIIGLLEQHGLKIDRAVEAGADLDLETLLSQGEINLPEEVVMEIANLQLNTQSQMKHVIQITSEMYTDLKELFKLSGVSYMQAKGEADFLLAGLAKKQLISAVFTEDMDLLTHGTPVLVRGLTDNSFRKDGLLTIYELDQILAAANFTMSQFVDMCILCGCDYAPKIAGLGPIGAYQKIKTHKCIESAIEKPPPEIAQARQEFQKSDTEPTEGEIKAPAINQASLITFLIAKTNYTEKTARAKVATLLSELPHTPHPPHPPPPSQHQPSPPPSVFAPLKTKISIKKKPTT